MNHLQLKNQCENFLHIALSTWANTGYDTTQGGYFEALDFDAHALHYDKRFRIHGRNIFSHVAGSVWHYADTLDTAEKAFEFITQKCWLHKIGGGFPTNTTVDGRPIDTTIKTYEHTFALLGLGWLSYTTKKPKHIQWFNLVWTFVEKKLSHSDGSFEVSIPHNPVRESNPHMHMFETMLNLYELFQDKKWLIVADRIYKLFITKLCKAEEGVLREFFTDNWKPDLSKGNLVDPGHHYEWVWLLRKYEKLKSTTVTHIPLLYNWATTHGTSNKGLTYDECYFNGKVYRDTHRLWVQTETLKAHLAMSERTQNKEEKQNYLNKAATTVQLLFKHYFITDKGIWYDQLNSRLQNISPNSPSSTLYHIVIALHEYINS